MPLDREPQEGDITYTHSDAGYVVSMLLRIETCERTAGQPPFVVHHRLICEPTPEVPTLDVLESLYVKIWHLPVAPENEQVPVAEPSVYLGNRPVTDHDLQGYYTYIQHARPDILEAADGNYARGCALLDEGRLDEALSAFSEALHWIPAFPQALDQRGMLYLRLGRVESAKSDFLHSIAVSDSDENPDPHLGLLGCFRQLEDQAAADEKLEQCMERWPDDPRLKPTS